MFIPAARTRPSSARSSCSEGARLIASIGVHTAPRANTRTPLTCRSSPFRSTSWAGLVPNASSRKPMLPTSTRVCERVPVTTRRTSCRAGSPCVCGHQRSTRGTSSSPCAVGSSAGPRSASCARCAPDGPSSSTSTERTCSSPKGRRLATTESTPRSPSKRGRSVSSSTANPRRRSTWTARHGPTAAGPGAKPGARPSSIVRKNRRLRSCDQARAPARARAARLVEQRRQRAAADRQLVAGAPPSVASLRCSSIAIVWVANIESLSRMQLAVEIHLGDRGDAVQAQAHLFARRDRPRVEGRTKPPVLARRSRAAHPRARCRRRAGRPPRCRGRARGSSSAPPAPPRRRSPAPPANKPPASR